MIDFLQTMSMTSARQLLLSIVAITIGTALPAAAQQDSTQDLKAAAAALIAQRVQFYNKKDAAGIAAELPRMRFLSSCCPDSKCCAEKQKSRSTTNSSLMPAPPALIKRSRRWS